MLHLYGLNMNLGERHKNGLKRHSSGSSAITRVNYSNMNKPDTFPPDIPFLHEAEKALQLAKPGMKPGSFH